MKFHHFILCGLVFLSCATCGYSVEEVVKSSASTGETKSLTAQSAQERQIRELQRTVDTLSRKVSDLDHTINRLEKKVDALRRR